MATATIVSPKSPKSPHERYTEFPNIHQDELDNDGEYVVNKEARPRQGSESGSDVSAELKTTKNGVVVLIPQPSESPDDPLNWTLLKKTLVFSTLIPGCFLTDGVITYGTTLFVQQAPSFMMTPPQISQSISGAIFLQGAGGILACILSMRYGRLPVLFWSQFLTLISSFGTVFATDSYAGFTASRTLQGFFAAAPQVIGLSMIYDLFFWHQRARVINIWALSFLIGPYLMPLISGFISESLSWENNFAVLMGFYAFSVLLIAVFGDETLFNRDGHQAPREHGIKARIFRLIGIEGVRAQERPHLWGLTVDVFALLLRPYLLVPTLLFVSINTMWTIGLVSVMAITVQSPPILLSPTATNFLFFAPMVGTLVAEFVGHFVNDFIAKTYIRNHNGRFKPEVRLWAVYFPWLLGMAGLILFGQAVEKNLGPVAIGAAWALNTFSTLSTTTPISAYLLDVLPHHSAMAAAWLNAMRTIGGFTVTYFISDWIARNGPAAAYGTQAGIIGFFIVSIIATQIFGPAWRKRFPAPTGGKVV